MRDIKGFEGLYAITSCGRVWSYRNKRFLKPTPDKDGYLTVILIDSKRGIRKNYKIHRLVGMAYIPNPDNKPEINHLDENHKNNSINNLSWVTGKENCNYGTRNQRLSDIMRRVKANV